MTRRAKAPARKILARPADDPAEELADEAPAGEVVDRPDGFYWRSRDGTREGGPFETTELARDDLEANDLPDIGPVESLREAESEIGVADWIDPETGEPAEGSAPPRLGEE